MSLFQYELAGCVTEQVYAQSIPKECSMSFGAHMDAMLCWGLMSSIEKGHKMDCGGCDETKDAVAERRIRIAERKASRKN